MAASNNVQLLTLIVIHRFRAEFVSSEHVDDLTNIGLRTLNELINYFAIELESLPVTPPSNSSVDCWSVRDERDLGLT